MLRGKLIPPDKIVMTPKMTIPFIQGGAFFCRKIWDIEQNIDNSKFEEHRYYVLSAITFSYSSIQSNINEFLYDTTQFITRGAACEEKDNLFAAIGKDKVTELAEFWNNTTPEERRRTLYIYIKDVWNCAE